MNLRPVSLATLMVMGSLSGAAMAQSRSTYIVELVAEPAATYTGTVAGYAATKPAAGSRYNARSPAAVAYQNYLANQQTSVTATVAKAPVLYRYNTVFNGFAAQLTAAEAAALRSNPKVANVVADEARSPDTLSTSNFLGLTAPGGVWSQSVNGSAIKGENVIIGIIDSGIWPEHASFADKTDAAGNPSHSGTTLAYGPPPAGWAGICQPGEGFTTAHCNNKLIGARYFNTGFIAGRPATGTNSKHFSEFYSPRDSGGRISDSHGGHGTHTASTAGGNANATVTVAGVPLGTASGMAPRARIAAYKVCYTYVNPAATDGTGSQNSCYTTDSVAAIDRAVADGVHVINYSISGSQTSVNDPVEQAYLRAANAGVFVATSAGNSGPGNAVAHVSPWLTTVAASTHDRAMRANVILGNGATYNGASVNIAPLPQAPLIRSVDAGLAGANAENVRLCFSSPVSLDPAKIAGKVVICDRGSNARVDKSLAVKNGGGVGMIQVDTGGGLVADAHSVPSVHVTAADGAAIKAYAISAAGTTAGMSVAVNAGQPAPVMAAFSSRGPNQGDANMLKPDVTAPGVDVIAAVTADLDPAQRDAIVAGTLVPNADWSSYQGTSMSSPHVAGLAALLRQAHPTWSPMAIKSALMTTAYTTLNDGQAGMANGLLPWAQGAGHVDPNKAIDPGLVYDASTADFIRYQCKANRAAVVPASDCTTVGTLDETYNHNLASITVGAVQGTVLVRRTVTNVGSSPATYNASATVPGFTTVVTPSTLTLAPGQSGSFTLRLTTAGAADGVWQYGSLTWTDGTHVVRSPVTARTGRTIIAPTALTGTTASGTRLITVTTGFAGRMTANKGGLKAVTMGPTNSLTGTPMSSTTLRAICNAGADTPSVKVYPVDVPAGAIVARFELRNADVGGGAADDNDLIIVAPGNTSAVYSGNAGSSEAVQIAAPAAGTYKVCVLAYDGSPVMTHKLSSWVVTTADVTSNLNVLLPGNAVPGGTATVGVAWSGLVAGGRYVGGFQLKDAAGGVQTTTVLTVNPAGAAPTAAAESMGDKLSR